MPGFPPSPPGRADGMLLTGHGQLELRQWQVTGATLPIVLLHEALGSSALWRDFPAALSRRTGRSTFAWSRAGHGSSSPITDTAGFDYLDREAERVPLAMDALGLEKVHLYGHSDGATIALMAASMFPDRVAGLILEAPHAIVEDVTLDGIAAARQLYREGDFRAKLARHHADPDAIFERWTRIWLSPAFRDWSIMDRLGAICAHTLVIQGADDHYASMGQIERICAAMPSARHISMPRCGHIPHREQPDAVLTAVAAFLEGKA